MTEWLVILGGGILAALGPLLARRGLKKERRALPDLPETKIAGITDGAIDGWRHLVDDDAFNRFLIADDTGQATVHAPFAIQLAPYREAFVVPPSPALASLLARMGVPAIEIFDATRALRYVETIVMPGDEVMAVGRIEIDTAGRAPSNRDPPVMCHLKGTADERVIMAAPT